MNKRLLIMLFLFLLASTARAASGVEDFYEKWMQHCPKKQILMTNPKIEIGRCVAFHESINGALCNELRVSDRVVGWVTDVHVAQSKVVAHLCMTGFDTDGSYFADRWSQPGTVSEQLYLLSVSTEDPERQLIQMVPLKLPGYSGYSSPSSCGTKMAYWSSREKGESSQWEALVVDLNDQSVISSKKMGFKHLETDNKGYLSSPIWNKSCDAVTFEYPQNMGKPNMTLELRK